MDVEHFTFFDISFPTLSLIKHYISDFTTERQFFKGIKLCLKLFWFYLFCMSVGGWGCELTLLVQIITSMNWLYEGVLVIFVISRKRLLERWNNFKGFKIFEHLLKKSDIYIYSIKSQKGIQIKEKCKTRNSCTIQVRFSYPSQNLFI